MEWKTMAKGIALGLILVVVIMAGKSLVSADIPSTTTDELTTNVVAIDGEYQEVELKMVNYEYVLEPSTLTKDVPVRMTVDLDSVYGCMRDVVISAFESIKRIP